MLGQRHGGDGRQWAAVFGHLKQAIVGHLPDGHAVEVPPGEDLPDAVFGPGLGHEQHPLLALREHDLVGGHSLLPPRDAGQIHGDACVAAACHLACRAGKARRTHVLDADNEILLHDLQAGLEQELFRKRVAHLNRRSALFARLVEILARHGGPVNPVTARLAANVHDGVAGTVGTPSEDAVVTGKAYVEDVDQGVAVVDLAEVNLPPYSRHADAVAVGRNPGHNTLHEVAVLGNLKRAEPEAVEARQRPRPHGENVPQDAPHACGGPLERLDEGGVIVAFDFEDQGQAAPDIHNPCILPWPLDDVGALGGEFP